MLWLAVASYFAGVGCNEGGGCNEAVMGVAIEVMMIKGNKSLSGCIPTINS